MSHENTEVINITKNLKDINLNSNSNNNDEKDEKIIGNADNITKTMCIKVENLRKNGYSSLEEWLKNPNNVYVGRRGRIFITEEKEGVKTRRLFHYPQSKFANPYKVDKQNPVENCIHQYILHLLANIQLYSEIKELKGKTLGCFCNQNNPCHAKVLADIANKMN